MTLPYDPLVMDCDPGWDDALALLLHQSSHAATIST
jgi:inosine-uridine nucleoside N-ribohydrolase